MMGLFALVVSFAALELPTAPFRFSRFPFSPPSPPFPFPAPRRPAAARVPARAPFVSPSKTSERARRRGQRDARNAHDAHARESGAEEGEKGAAGGPRGGGKGEAVPVGRQRCGVAGLALQGGWWARARAFASGGAKCPLVVVEGVFEVNTHPPSPAPLRRAFPCAGGA